MSRGFLPYGRQLIEEDDIAAVAAVLRSDWLTSGPAVERFERALAGSVGASHAVVCNSGTAALYLAARAWEFEPGDTVIVPSLTFAATASAQVLAGLDVVLADVDADSGLMTAGHAEDALGRAKGRRVRAITPVHLTGQMADPAAIADFARKHGLVVVEDACHALGTTYGGDKFRVGGCAHSAAACFSFHPVKTIAMGEGGAVTTNDKAKADAMRRLRSHGITRAPGDFTNPDVALASDGTPHAWYYELGEISHNLRASDINCALGDSQLRKLPRFAAARRRLAERYRSGLTALGPKVKPVPRQPGVDAAWHLFCVLVDFESVGVDRDELIKRLHAGGIGSQVHYIPLHLQPFYRKRSGGIRLPGAEAYYRRVLSLPLFVEMTDSDVDRVIATLAKAIGA